MLSCAFPWNLLHTPSALAARSDPILAIARENLGLTEGLGEISAFLGSPFGSRQVPYAQSSSKEDVSSPRSPRSFFPGDACEATGTAFPGSCRKPSTATPTATLPADPASYIAAPRRRPSPGQRIPPAAPPRPPACAPPPRGVQGSGRRPITASRAAAAAPAPAPARSAPSPPVSAGERHGARLRARPGDGRARVPAVPG